MKTINEKIDEIMDKAIKIPSKSFGDLTNPTENKKFMAYCEMIGAIKKLQTEIKNEML